MSESKLELKYIAAELYFVGNLLKSLFKDTDKPDPYAEFDKDRH